MKPIVRKLLLILMLTFLVTSLYAQTGSSLLNSGITNFKNARYSDSLSFFRDVIIDPNQADYHSDAYFWIAKSYIALRQLDNAEENLDFFILNFPSNKYYEEAVYQKGRLMFLQNDYENCILESSSFIETYPDSAYAANAYYWSAESLYALGRLEEAESLYTHVIYTFPSSYKVEASNYRLAMIEQKYREESLVELLKLTHEEYLKSIEEFQVREKTYENALDSYQKKLSSLDSSSVESSGQSLSIEILDLNTTVRNKDNEIMALKRKIAELEYRLTNAETKAANSEKKVIEVNPEIIKEETQEVEVKSVQTENSVLSSEQKLKLLEIKSRALEIKSQYLEYLNSMGTN